MFGVSYTLLQNEGKEDAQPALSVAPMAASGFEFKAGFNGCNRGTGGVNKISRRVIRASRTRVPTAPISSDPKVDNSQNGVVLGQVSSWPPVTQSNIDASEHNGQSEEIQPVVADEEGSCISTEMGDLNLSNIKLENHEVATNSLPLVMVSRVLKGIPQNPHFYQLRNHSDLARKTLISAWDRIFEEAVDRIQSLQVNGYWVAARDLWKTMEELQSMGYNVIPLRRRIVELSDVIGEVKLCKLEMKRLKIKAENHRAEKSTLEFVVLNLQDKMKKEEEEMKRAMNQAAEIKKELPNSDAAFAKILSEPLTV